MYLALGILAGVLTVISVALNAQLGEKIGVLQGVLINFIAGFTLITVILTVALTTGSIEFIKPEGVPIYAFFGGAIGCAIASSCNIVLPKIPVLYATILMFVGQLICGIVIDKVFYDLFSPGKLIGGALIAFGIYLVSKKDSKEVALES